MTCEQPSLWGRLRSLLASRVADSRADRDVAQRSRDRYQRITQGVAAAFLSRGIAVATSLISIPITVKYLGTERFGVWATISSFTALLAFADLGIGNGLVNAIAATRGGEDRDLARTHASSAYALLAPVALALLGAFLLARAWISWADAFGLEGQAAITEARQAVAVFVTCFCVGIPLSIAGRLQMGMQASHLSHGWTAAGGLASLAAVLAAVAVQASLPGLVFALVGAPLVIQALNTGVLLHQRPWLRPSLRHVRWFSARQLLRDGSLFFLLQISTAFIFASDNLVIARLFGPAAVTQYAIPFRLFGLASTLVGMALGPLWPAYGEALARGDLSWLRVALSRSLRLALVASLASSAVLLVSVPWLVKVWTGLSTPQPLLLLAGFAMFNVVLAVSNAYSTFLNGINLIRFQVVLGLLTSVLAVALKVGLGTVLGLPGVAFGSALALLAGAVIPFIWYVPRLLGELERRALRPGRQD